MTNPQQQAREGLGQRLRELRKDARLSQRRLAEFANWHETKVSKIEHGKQTPSEDDIRTWCRLVGADLHIPDLIATVRHIDSAYLEWRRQWRVGAHRRQQAIAAWEADTTLFRIFEPLIIPGLFQTEAYARARAEENIAFHGLGGSAEAAVQARMERQEVLHRGDIGRRFQVVLAESALTLGTARDDVLVEQLERLLTLSIMPRISLGIIPTRARWRRAPHHAFWILDDRLALVETVAAELTINQPRDIAVYVQEFNALSASATFGQDARDLITAAIRTVQTAR